MTSKYIGKIYDGRWEVIRFEKCGEEGKRVERFILKNIYNKEEIVINGGTIRRIDRGLTTVSSVICYRIKKSKDYRKSNWR